ncbi:MAG: permease-like cell division protein FtsX [Candidatus Faecousia sp.]|nr:permease-like cell division protein FtsX [Candidatus Faecousia sp.]
MKKSKNIGYLFQEGFRGIFLHGFMSFAAVCVTVACLIIIGSFSMILYNLQLLVTELEQQNEVLVYIDETYNTAQAKSVGSQINLIPNVQNAVFKSREEALNDFIAEQGDIDAFGGVISDDLRDRFVVTLVDNAQMEQTVEAIAQIPGVADINDHPEIAQGFTTIQNVLNVAAAAIIIVLLVVSLFIISNTIKLAMYDRRDEIAIMKMVGATNGFIRLPYVVEGSLIGIFSAAVAFFAEWGLYDLVAAKIQQIDSLQLFAVVPFMDVIWPMVATFGITGLLVGVLGSLMSIRKFLDV